MASTCFNMLKTGVLTLFIKQSYHGEDGQGRVGGVQIDRSIETIKSNRCSPHDTILHNTFHTTQFARWNPHHAILYDSILTKLEVIQFAQYSAMQSIRRKQSAGNKSASARSNPQEAIRRKRFAGSDPRETNPQEFNTKYS